MKGKINLSVITAGVTRYGMREMKNTKYTFAEMKIYIAGKNDLGQGLAATTPLQFSLMILTKMSYATE